MNEALEVNSWEPSQATSSVGNPIARKKVSTV